MSEGEKAAEMVMVKEIQEEEEDDEEREKDELMIRLIGYSTVGVILSTPYFWVGIPLDSNAREIQEPPTCTKPAAKNGDDSGTVGVAESRGDRLTYLHYSSSICLTSVSKY